MTSVMQQTAMSVAERKCRDIIRLKLGKEDEALVYYLTVWEEELWEEHKRLSPRQHSFYTSLVVTGTWAAEIVAEMQPDNFPTARKQLARRIVQAWFECKDADDERRFASVIRSWPAVEANMLADTVRHIIQTHSSRLHDSETARRLMNYLAWASDDIALTADSTVYRTMFKTLGNHARLEDIAIAVKVMRGDRKD